MYPFLQEVKDEKGGDKKKRKSDEQGQNFFVG